MENEVLPESAKELDRLIGKKKSRLLARAYGGKNIYVPKTRRRTRLENIIGRAATDALQTRWAGQSLTLPALAGIARAARDSQIHHALDGGASCVTVACLHGLSARQIQNIRKRARRGW